MNREQLKTLILTLLIIMSVVFTQQIWFHSPIAILQSEASSQERQLKNIEKKKEVIMPKRGIVSFGNNYHTIISTDIEELWTASKVILEDFFTGEPEVISTTYDKYRENNRLKSIELEFGKNISSVLVGSVFDTVDNKIVMNIKEVKKILIPALNRGVIYIVGKEDHVYEVKLDNHQENRFLLALIDDLQTANHIKYYPLFADVDNYTVMPLSYQQSTPQVFVESNINVENEQMVIEEVKSFFNESLDFVKTIRETSGAIVFMYGYGEKGVRINNRGRLEYTEEIRNFSSSNVVTALEIAIEFVEDHGGFPEDAYLKEIRYEEKKGYYFGFGYRIEGLPVAFNSGNLAHPIEIEVYGDKVRSYRSLIRKGKNLPNVSPTNYTLLPQKIIEDHIELLKADYLADIEEKDLLEEKEILNYIERNIAQMELVYYDTLEDARIQLLIPTWKIKINKRVYYFSSYDGKLLHSGLVN
ncbi:Two-component signal transduction system YycFG, regulatory protein YycH [Natronincola peptidivorans]|uniref:Two-component signal transduction system YycFG, regulatory protein YycH n=1 Tax=Natronincola peptidivorans TaxID=426128 RepID=A0A1I0B3H5_9FIRM|nr:two-component system activity regulator YycH [Natronincola peptidivorans]SET01398.1 Two-component signal transduction system YycFG, regulatory protein YycH [Natronincola peptidivorans]